MDPLPEEPAPRPSILRGLLVVGLALALLAAVLVATGVLGGEDEFDPDRIAELAQEGAEDDPFAYEDGRREDFERRAALGYSHVIFEKSPGGIVASARRTARWRDEIERAAEAHDTDPAAMEAMVLLESAGRPEVIAGDDPEAASGLAQIVASTGIDLLGMDIDLSRSQRLTKQIAATESAIADATEAAAEGSGKRAQQARRKLPRLREREESLRAERVKIDPRFDPEAALEGMGRYLEIAEERFGRDDLALASYHMGIGNLEGVIARYTGRDPAEAGDLPYAQLFFDSSPLEHAPAWQLLASFGDDSSTYPWRVLAANRIMTLHRDDPDGLRQEARLHAAKATQEEVFHPRERTEAFTDPEDLLGAFDADELIELPEGEGYGYAIDPKMGELASQVGGSRESYRALRPEALAALIYLTVGTQEINDGNGALNITSTVRDQAYQDALTGSNPEATSNYSLHTTGYAFDIARDYSSDRQAQAFQFMLDRLRALNVIDYAVEPRAIHITVSDEAQALLDA